MADLSPRRFPLRPLAKARLRSAELSPPSLTPSLTAAPSPTPVGDKRAPAPSPIERLVISNEAKNKPIRKRVVACGRVSTDDQALGRDLQAAKFTAYAVAHDLELVKVFSDELSGKSMERPGLLEALAMLERGEADGLLVTKLDRLTRSVADFESLLARYFAASRYELLSVEDAIDTRTAMGRFVLRLHVALGQLERERLAERTKESLEHLRRSGGGIPRIEGAAARRMLDLEAQGKTLREIADALTEERVPTLKGGKWAPETVRRVLARAHAAQAR